jgi:hypothetical protein
LFSSPFEKGKDIKERRDNIKNGEENKIKKGERTK